VRQRKQAASGPTVARHRGRVATDEPHHLLRLKPAGANARKKGRVRVHVPTTTPPSSHPSIHHVTLRVRPEALADGHSLFYIHVWPLLRLNRQRCFSALTDPHVARLSCRDAVMSS